MTSLSIVITDYIINEHCVWDIQNEKMTDNKRDGRIQRHLKYTK